MSLKLKDAVVDQIRERTGTRPTIEKNRPDVFLRSKIVRGKGTLQAHIFADLFGELYQDVDTESPPYCLPKRRSRCCNSL